MKAHIFKFIGGTTVAMVGFGFIIMLLWNALLPDIFAVSSISFWQALGLLALARILFGGIAGGMMKHLHHHQHNPIREKWEKMTPEERTKFINKRRNMGFKGHFGREHFDMNENGESDEEKE